MTARPSRVKIRKPSNRMFGDRACPTHRWLDMMLFNCRLSPGQAFQGTIKEVQKPLHGKHLVRVVCDGVTDYIFVPMDARFNDESIFIDD